MTHVVVAVFARHLYFNPMTHVVVAVVAIVISYFSVITMDGQTNSQSIT
jgi:hypothetical protein